MPQIVAQTSYFQTQLLLITYNSFIITVSSKCVHHFSSKMANPVTLKMDGKTIKSCNTLQPSTLHKGGTRIPQAFKKQATI